MKRIFVAFCGGCKPEIDRKRLLQEIQKLLPDYHFQYALEEDGPVCCSLILNGCATECRTRALQQYPKCISVRGEMIGDTVVKEESLPGQVAHKIETCAQTCPEASPLND